MITVTDNVHSNPFSGVESWKGDNVQCALQLPGQSGLWEIGLTRLADGTPEVWVWMAPDGFSGEKTAAAIKLNVDRNETGKTTTYQAEIPFEAIGLSEKTGRKGFLFNLFINDNDGKGRNKRNFDRPGYCGGEIPRPLPHRQIPLR